MTCQFIARRSMTGAIAAEPSRVVRALDPVVSATILNCRTASAVTRRPNDPCRGLGHDATRRAAG